MNREETTADARIARALVVEEDPALALNVAESLAAFFRVRVRANGEDALEALRREDAEVIVVPLEAHGTYGPLFWSRVRREFPRALLVVTYRYEDRTQEMAAWMERFTDLHVTIPFEADRLRERVLALVQQKQEEEEKP